MKNKPLLNIRKKLDQIDEKIIDLLKKRINLIEKVKRIKLNSKEPVYQPSREAEKINKILKYNNKIFPEQNLVNIFTEIFAASITLQKKLKIGYLGPEATFTHLAAIKHFGSGPLLKPFLTIKDIFVGIETSRIDYGVVPIENSNEGVVGYTLDMLLEFNTFIINELYIEIFHNIVSKEEKLSSIKTLFSHPQALAQCRIYIENNLRNVKIIETSSTSEAARKAAKTKFSAAIASSLAAKVYNLNLLDEKINDNLNNYTRFLVISKSQLIQRENIKYKTSIVCGVKDKPGALFSLLKPFNDNKINLTKIESRPTKKKAWEYLFFIDFIGKLSNNRIKTALKKIEELTTFLKILGSYPASNFVFKK